jgi:hypothetical protein
MPSILFIKNIAVYTLSVDFNDGLGYRTITPGIPLNVTYSDTGVYKWIYRINVAGVNYHCESYIHIKAGYDEAVTLFNGCNNKYKYAS